MIDVSVVIPTHNARVRSGMLDRALRSVLAQTMQPAAIIVQYDVDLRGSAPTRNRGLAAVLTPWVAFLDSDDEWLPNHLEVLTTAAANYEGASPQFPADVIYSGCRVVGHDGREVPLRDEWGRFGRAFDPDLLRQQSYIPVTSLVRMDALGETVRFVAPAGTTYDDWGFYLRLLDRGARFVHVPEVTWTWHHHGMNTSGVPGQGDAR